MRRGNLPYLLLLDSSRCLRLWSCRVQMQQTTVGHTERAELEATAQAYIERLEADRSR